MTKQKSINFLQHLSAERLKLKGTPVIYLAAAGSVFVMIIVFIGHIADLHSLARLNINPWFRYFPRAIAVYAVFTVVPLTVLIVSAVLFVEKRAEAWKYLYTMPTSRGKIYFSKLAILLGILIFGMLLMILLVVLSGYMLNIMRPEYEFAYHRPPFKYFTQQTTHTFFSLLGLIGLQYFLSIRFKNFLLPLGIGLVGFISGLILSLSQSKLALYYPYSHPMIAKDYGMFRTPDSIKLLWEGAWLNNVELYSILCFLVFALLGYWLERKRNID